MAKVGMNFLLTFDKYLINMRKCIDKNVFKNVKINTCMFFRTKYIRLDIPMYKISGSLVCTEN